MTRVAAIYDIHGNLPALDAVLADIERQKVDLIVVGGDIAWGPFPRETVERLRELEGATCIRGNADREVATGSPDEREPGNPVGEITSWVREQLTDEQVAWLGDLPPSQVAAVDRLGDVLFCHGSPRSDEEAITHLSPVDRLREALGGVGQRTVVCGHTHMQFERRMDDHRIVNAGSVGLPYQGEGGAFWLLLGPGLQLHRTDYDVEAAARSMSLTDCPHVSEVFASTLLEPPAADEVARRFEEAEMRRSY